MISGAPRAIGVSDSPGGRFVEWTAALACGVAPGSAPPDWGLLFRFAVLERCAAVAWLRSAALIRARAPAEVSERWRHYTHSSCVAGWEQLSDAAEVAAAARKLDIFPVVLKGAPLALKLYGDAGARCSDDIDLFVARNHRDAFAGLLEDLGWRVLWGSREGDENHVRELAGTRSYLEVHSFLLQARRSSLQLVPEARPLKQGDVSLLAQDGSLELSYLAFNAAKHRHPPLGRFLDLLTLWEGLDDVARRGAVDEARHVGLSRYLKWGMHRAQLVRAAAQGDAAAVRALGYRGTAHRDAHPGWRHVGLSDSYGDAARFVGSYVVPPWQQTTYGAGVSGTVRRLATRARVGRWSDALRGWRGLLPSWQERRISGDSE
ncbi:MAG: nucleotidyltransferase family protein [Gemmatimonadota bacterium]|nr:nucleotidyltransferase family protein [Gemmatimonadota bacterium]